MAKVNSSPAVLSRGQRVAAMARKAAADAAAAANAPMQPASAAAAAHQQSNLSRPALEELPQQQQAAGPQPGGPAAGRSTAMASDPAASIMLKGIGPAAVAAEGRAAETVPSAADKAQRMPIKRSPMLSPQQLRRQQMLSGASRSATAATDPDSSAPKAVETAPAAAPATAAATAAATAPTPASASAAAPEAAPEASSAAAASAAATQTDTAAEPVASAPTQPVGAQPEPAEVGTELSPQPLRRQQVLCAAAVTSTAVVTAGPAAPKVADAAALADGAGAKAAAPADTAANEQPIPMRVVPAADSTLASIAGSAGGEAAEPASTAAEGDPATIATATAAADSTQYTVAGNANAVATGPACVAADLQPAPMEVEDVPAGAAATPSGHMVANAAAALATAASAAASATRPSPIYSSSTLSPAASAVAPAAGAQLVAPGVPPAAAMQATPIRRMAALTPQQLRRQQMLTPEVPAASSGTVATQHNAVAKGAQTLAGALTDKEGAEGAVPSPVTEAVQAVVVKHSPALSPQQSARQPMLSAEAPAPAASDAAAGGTAGVMADGMAATGVSAAGRGAALPGSNAGAVVPAPIKRSPVLTPQQLRRQQMLTAEPPVSVSGSAGRSKRSREADGFAAPASKRMEKEGDTVAVLAAGDAQTAPVFQAMQQDQLPAEQQGQEAQQLVDMPQQAQEQGEDKQQQQQQQQEEEEEVDMQDVQPRDQQQRDVVKHATAAAAAAAAPKATALAQQAGSGVAPMECSITPSKAQVTQVQLVPQVEGCIAMTFVQQAASALGVNAPTAGQGVELYYQGTAAIMGRLLEVISRANAAS